MCRPTNTKGNSGHVFDSVFKYTYFERNQFHWNHTLKGKNAFIFTVRNGLSTVAWQVSSKTSHNRKSSEIFLLEDAIANKIKIQYPKPFYFNHTINLYFSKPRFHFKLLRQCWFILEWRFVQLRGSGSLAVEFCLCF